MLFRQLMDPETSTWTYLLADEETGEAILIDPVREQFHRDTTLLAELGLHLVATVETHVHADHITAGWLHKQHAGSRIVLPASAGVSTADQLADEGDPIRFGRYAIETRLTPGHTNGCATYVCAELGAAFTGDTLLIRGCGRTDFQEGNAHTLWRSVHDQIFSLPDETRIYPGHDYKGRTVSTVGEEKRFNPRLGGGRTEAEFVTIMEGLGLAYPKKIDVAVPANLELGRIDGDPGLPRARYLWEGSTRSPSGVRHVDPAWVADHLGQVRLIDVREPAEFEDELGHIDGAELVPLATLETAATTWDTAAPLVTVCRSSGRSDRAAQQLARLGFREVASMVGGMLAWNRSGARARTT